LVQIEKQWKKVRSETSSGNFSYNETAYNYACTDLPFGGVGQSGMGTMNGINGFKAMSHCKSVFEKGAYNGYPLNLRYPPYTQARINGLNRLGPFMGSTINKVKRGIKWIGIIGIAAVAYKMGYLDPLVQNLEGIVMGLFNKT